MTKKHRGWGGRREGRREGSGVEEEKEEDSLGSAMLPMTGIVLISLH